MRLYFLRHGPAADRAAWQGNDFDRPLTDDGRERIAREAKVLAKLDLSLDRIVTSPLVRAKETAAIVADRLKMGDRLVDDERLGPHFSLKRLGELLEANSGVKAIMLVGHEPEMSETIGRLVGGAWIDLKKGGVACVDLREPADLTGQLLWLLPPRILTAART